ncbi:multiple inositol polyphosphate phosphatase 1-like isoform X3 [Zootermopsis nevadensis]|uniref:Multiple inositol polyphosphate phosphatase 1 n=1 Tax=Zootermopsis nevadensis TaxID=136037 RepID=A0A067R6V0_ZOONE|nr:multiple inositol polyphosphate phosphatase 1-like isoform X3 [Zootermopsis nevadensis]KDR19047.1 Multiple inositol polyphosphate phosphatase 1 [Zootermopsis nevadensis]
MLATIGRMMFFMLWAALLARLVTGQSQDSCYADDVNPYLLFATDTPYEEVNDMNARPVIIEQCEAKQFWLISRHGTRYADADEVDDLKDLYDLQAKIIKNHEKDGKGTLCAQDLENLKLWTLQVVSNVKSDLTPQGYKDLHDLGDRFKSRFPALFNQTVTKDSFKVRFTTKQRTAASAIAFVDGLFGTGMGLEFPEPLDDDLLIKPYASCKKWEKDVESNKDTTKEMKNFEGGALVTTLLGTVSSRLGFDKTLDIDDINLIYSACRYDKAWHLDKVSPWCAAFTDDDLKVLEYREDLELYYSTGYGNDLNKKVGCPPVKDFLDRFSDIEKGNAQPAGVLYFTHHEMILLLLTSLGFDKDQQPLTSKNYDQMSNRQWRSSVISPFAANLAAVFFECGVGEPYRVQLYFNEHLLDIDGCTKGLCDWSYFKKQFGSISSSCNLDFC